MSNLLEFKEAIGKINTENNDDIALLGAAIGTIADFAGAAGAVVSVIGFIGSLFGLGGGGDQTQAELDKILSTIDAEFKQLNLNTQAEDLKNQLASINSYAVTRAVSIAENLESDLTVDPPLSSGDKSSRLEDCLTAVNSLSPVAVAGGLNQVWQVVHDYQVYFAPTHPWLYEDGGLPSADFPFTYEGLTFRNTFDPGADPNGLVFNYVYILPAYLRTILIYLAVGTGFYPNFGRDDQDHAAQLRKIADDLLSAHDTIKGGIVSVTAPSKDDVIIFTWITELDTHRSLDETIQPEGDQYEGTSLWKLATYPPCPPGECYYEKAPPTDYTQPYGAVNLYSGYSSVGSYPGPGLPPGHYSPFFPPVHVGPNAWPPPDWYLGFYGKYLLRTLARNKDVYRGIGLSKVRKTINRLRSLVGDPLLVGSSFGDWSLREVFSVLGYPANHLIAARTARNLVGFLANAAPTSALAIPISLRQMLEGPPPG